MPSGAQEDVAREMEREYLQEKLQVLADELEFRDRELAALRTMRTSREDTLISAGSWALPPERGPDRLPSELPPRDPEQDLELQVTSLLITQAHSCVVIAWGTGGACLMQTMCNP